jgi:hypothetical protein
MTVKLDSNLAEELVKFKLKSIQDTLKTILEKWHESNTDDFIRKARTGELTDAEPDAIVVRQLITDLDRLDKVLKRITVSES